MPKQSLKQMVHFCTLLVFILSLVVQAAPVHAQMPTQIVVNSTGDEPDVGFGLPCETATGNGVCTLRAAIKAANENQSLFGAVITFNIDHDIPATPTIIDVLTALPKLTLANTTIQGPNLHDGSVIVLDGNDGNYHGLDIRANNCTIKKLTIANFSGVNSYGISVGSTSIDPVTGALITGNIIGNMVPFNFIADLSNYGGIKLENTLSSVIGGDTAADRNVISGNLGYGVKISASATNVVKGNFIGVKDDGSTPLPNTYGVYISNSTGNTIGGALAGRRNVISGNSSDGIFIEGNSNVVQGNYIGTDVSGTLAVPNGNIGVRVGNPGTIYSENKIGGTGPGEGNLISGNATYGIQVVNSDLTTIQGNIIGLNASQTTALPNNYGISLSNSLNNFIGGTTAGSGNVIAGNTRQGIFVGQNCVNTSIRANFIGVNSTGQALGNGMDGIVVQYAMDTNIGGTSDAYENIIAHNGGNGIEIESAYAKVMGNQIYDNDELGIDVWRTTNQKGVTPNDPDESDDIQNFPVIKSVSFPSAGRVLFAVEVPTLEDEEVSVSFFASDSCDPSGHGEGQVYLGYVTDIAVGGLAEFVLNLPLPDAFMFYTATAWGQSQGQSEFSACTSANTYLPVILR